MPVEPRQKVGVYICHCGSNIAGTVDVEAVRDWAAESLAGHGVVIARDNKFMCSSTGPGAHRAGHRRARPDPGRRRRLLAAHAREDVPRRLRPGRPQPVPVRAGLDPRAGLVGPHRQGGCHRQGQGRRGRRRLPRGGARPAGADPGADQPGHARRGRRDRGHHRDPGAGGRGLPGPPRRARAVDRRPHGHVRQDVPDPRLRRLHPDPEDERRRDASRTSPSTRGAR